MTPITSSSVTSCPFAVREDLSGADSAITNRAQPLCTGSVEGRREALILEALNKVSLEERSDVIHHAQPLLRGIEQYDVLIIEAVNKVAQDQRADVIARAQPLLRGTEQYDVLIIEAVNKVAQDQRADVIAHAQPLLRGTEQYDILIIEAVNKVAQDQRADVIAHAQPLLEGTAQYDPLIIEAVSKVAQDQRADVVKQAPLLLTGYFADDVQIIQGISKIPQEERTDVVWCVRPLFAGKQGLWRPLEIIRAVGQIPQGERADVICCVRLLFAEGRIKWSGVEVIEAVSKVPRNERVDVICHAHFLLTGKAVDDVQIIEAVREVPQKERQDIIHRASFLFTDQTPWIERVRILRNEAAEGQKTASAPLRHHMEEVSSDVLERHGISSRDLKKIWNGQDKSVSQFQESVQNFWNYIRSSLAHDRRRQALVCHALYGDQRGNDFGPLINGQWVSLFGFPILGEHLVGSLWLFASQIKDIEDQSKAKQGMIAALEKSYEIGVHGRKSRVCHAKKVELLLIHVLQGRLNK